MTGLRLAALARLRKNWVGLALILAGVAVLVIVMGVAARWKAGNAGRAAAHGGADLAVSQAGDRASAVATEAIAGLGERDTVRTTETMENRDAILAAPNARDDAGAAGDVGLASVCRRAAYRDHPRCAGLRSTHPASASR